MWSKKRQNKLLSSWKSLVLIHEHW
jgi:hypothetical protein